MYINHLQHICVYLVLFNIRSLYLLVPHLLYPKLLCNKYYQLQTVLFLDIVNLYSVAHKAQ